MSKAENLLNLLEKAKDSYEFQSANLWYYGTSRDLNGNKTAIFGFPNDRNFSIQANDSSLPLFSKMDKKGLSVTPEMEKEAIDYISKYGSAKQKAKLHVYKNQG